MKASKINIVNAIKLVLLTMILTLFFSVKKVSAQVYFSNFEGSQVKISGGKNNLQSVTITNPFSCEGKFTMVDGELQYLSALKFNLPMNAISKEQDLLSSIALNSTAPRGDINFELTHSMVLPELNMIHAIGYLDIQGVKTRVNFHLDYIENDNQTITVMGKRIIKLNDFKKEQISAIADAKSQDVILLDLKLVIKNPAKVEYIAAVTK